MTVSTVIRNLEFLMVRSARTKCQRDPNWNHDNIGLMIGHVLSLQKQTSKIEKKYVAWLSKETQLLFLLWTSADYTKKLKGKTLLCLLIRQLIQTKKKCHQQ